MALLYLLISLQITNISRFDYINSIVFYLNKLYLGTDGGVVVYNLIEDKIEATLTDMPAELAVPDPATPDVYFYYNGGIYRWYPVADRHARFIALVGNAESIGADFDYLYVEKSDGTVWTLSKMTGARMDGVSPAENTIWAGRKSELSKDDVQLNFLIPMFEFVDGLGRVDYTVFYRANGMIWVGTDGDGIRCYDEFSHILRKKLRFGIVPREVRCISLVSNGVWIGGYGGATFIGPNERMAFSTEATFAFKCDPIVDIVPLEDTTVMFATPCGLAFYRNGGLMPKDLNLEVTSATATDYGIFVGTEKGVLYSESAALPFRRIFKQLLFPITDIFRRNDDVVILSSLGTFSVAPDLSIQKLDDPRGWLSFFPESGCESPDHLTFIATADGLVEIDGDSTSYHAPPFDASSLRVNCVACDRRFVWLATDDGLYVFERDTQLWRRIGPQDGLAGNRCFTVAVKADTVFVGTDSGLSILTDFP